MICERQDCTACGACVQACPKQCISMMVDENGFMYPTIDKGVCIQCNACKRVCHISQKLNRYQASFYMGWHKDTEVQLNSSSGGAYTAIAELVLESGGVVFGAYMDSESRDVKHIRVNSINELWRTRFSKYYQGDINNTYIEVKKLIKNRLVLFSGTACQIAGLLSFLGKEDDNLLTVDVLCHGITSKKVVEAYIKSKEKQYGKKVKAVSFRVKPPFSNWLNGGGTRMKIEFEDGTYVIEDKEYDTFFVGFNSYLFLRESCYHCRYSGQERISDFTLADFWGVDSSKVPEEQTRNGISLLLCNTEKGKKLLIALNQKMKLEEINPNDAIPYNQALVKPSTNNSDRGYFFEHLERDDFDSIIKKLNRKKYALQKIKKIIGNDLYMSIRKALKKT